MVCHKHVGVQAAALSVQRLAQLVKVSEPVLLVEEAGGPIVPTLHDVQRQAVNVDWSAAGHMLSLA